MFFVWSGSGYWALIAPVVTLIAMMEADEHWFHASTAWPLALALAIAGLFCVGLGAHARLQPKKAVLERQTGRELVVGPVHSVYWVRAEYWGVGYLLLAAWLLTLPPPPPG